MYLRFLLLVLSVFSLPFALLDGGAVMPGNGWTAPRTLVLGHQLKMSMKQTVAIVLTLALLSASALAGPPLPMAGIVREARIGASDFRLFDGTHTADVVVDGADSKTVKLAAGLFCDDIGRIGGTKARLVNDIGTAAADCVIVGSMKESGLIKKLASEGKIDLREIEGQWEACVVATVDKPFAGIERALVIAGSDRRGTAYGLFEISNQMGVSPWYFFADVAPKRKASVLVGAGRYLQRPPSVKYRGIFINDELWGIRPWALHAFAPEEGKGLGPKTNAKIFELLLRLKANTLWPAMHPKAKPFNYFERNKIVADEYGIVMGSSHIEPMLRNNIAGTEWDTEYPGEPWDYTTNREHIYQYWEKRVMENGRYENLYTVGKRGQDDEAGTEVTVPVMERIFVDQRTILGKHVNPDVTKVPQVLIMYTEVLGLYNSGLKVPDDVILCWPDDNFGYIRQLPSAMEQKRPGGSGVYYHFQWLNGATTAYTWTCTTPPALTWLEMKRAYDFNARDLWIVNVGDIKPAEIDIEHFMQLAWDISSWDHRTTRRFLARWAAREFGGDHAEAIAGHYEVVFSVFNPATPTREEVPGHVESHGYISIEAEHYTRKIDAGGGGWELVDGLGRSGASITVLPPTLASVKGVEDIRAKAPCVEYDLYAFTTGNAVVRLNCIPSNPITRDHGVKVAIALDDQAPQLVTQVLGKSIIDNLMSLTGNVRIEKEGPHLLKVWMVDPGVTIDKIIIDMGGVKDSYLGPPESYSNQPPHNE